MKHLFFIIFASATVYAMAMPPSITKLSEAEWNARSEAFYKGEAQYVQRQSHQKGKRSPNWGTRPWKNGVVFYSFHEHLSANVKRLVKEAASQITQKTGGCVRFVEGTDQAGYIHIYDHTKKHGCRSSDQGFSGKVQYISLPSGCVNIGTVLHELMHAIGFGHEHQRSDRDDFIKIIWENIKEDDYAQYTKHTDSILSTKFNFDSIMMYGPYVSVYNDKRRTIVADDRRCKLLMENEHPIISVFIGIFCAFDSARTWTEAFEKKSLADTDVKMIKEFYNCG
jgi:hypothetical protein